MFLQPKVLIVVDAAWDTALDKITWLYDHSESWRRFSFGNVTKWVFLII